jgi:hypothetical protein
VEREAGDERTRQINRAFALTLQRAPTNDERTTCETLLRERTLAELCRALLNLNEFIYID